MQTILCLMYVLFSFFNGQSLRKPAVVLVDMQSETLNWMDPTARTVLVKHQKEVLKKCAKVNLPLIVIETKGGGKTDSCFEDEIQKFARKRFVIKRYNDGFKQTSTDELLKQWNAQSIIMMGLQDSVCVWETTQSALKSGYNVATSPQIIYGFLPMSFAGKIWYMRKCLYRNNAMDIFKHVQR